jgi:hypothetical protein
MTIWAKNFQVLHAVVRSIAVFVMYAKNLVVCVESASLARIQQASSLHVFSNGTEISLPVFNCGFVDARSRTILSFFGRRGKEFCFAVHASVFNSSFGFHGFVIAVWTAILGPVCSACNVLKNCIADFASCFLKSSRRQCHATSTAKNSCVFSVLGDKKLFLAMATKLFVFHSGARYATHT